MQILNPALFLAIGFWWVRECKGLTWNMNFWIILKGQSNVLTRFYCETLDLEKVQNVNGQMCASTVFQ